MLCVLLCAAVCCVLLRAVNSECVCGGVFCVCVRRWRAAEQEGEEGAGRGGGADSDRKIKTPR